MDIESKLNELGLVLPEAMKAPPNLEVPFVPVKVVGNVAYLSGHMPQTPEGGIMDLLGRVGSDVTLEQAVEAAKITGLSLLGSLKREIGDLDRVETWIGALGMVNSAPSFNQYSVVINGFSSLIVELFGEDRGLHTRSAIGVAGLPFNVPVEIEAVVKLKD